MLETPPEQDRTLGGGADAPRSRPSVMPFLWTLLIGWLVLFAAGLIYGRSKGIPFWAAGPLLAAFLAEYPFYLVLAFPALRQRIGRSYLPAYVTVSAVLPYFLACMGASRFEWSGLISLAALALMIGLWYIVLPGRAALDIVFLALIPAVLLGGYFQAVFMPLIATVRSELAFLGHFILIQMTIVTLMLGREVAETGFGFVPTWREWRIGAVHYLYFAVAGLPLALALGAIRWKTPSPVWAIAGYLVGYLWVVALSEEFFFRGVLQSWIGKWTGSAAAGLLITSTLFGLVHLGFRGFPNWRWFLIAGVLGWCCGRARDQAGGIRAGVVTHALAVATWRAFFL